MSKTTPVATISWQTEQHPHQITDKFALMNSGIVPASAYRRDATLLRALKVESLRIDIGWGARWIGHPTETVRDDGTFDFSAVDAIARELSDAGVKPYWAYCYVPPAFRNDPNSWRSMAKDPTNWVQMVRSYVEGAAERDVRVGYHEVYNEPDLADELSGEKVFFDGDLDDYLELYRQTVTAIRSADPEAKVGGPALGSVHANHDWMEAFLDFVAANDLPLDFISFHHYGRLTAPSAWQTVIALVKSRPHLDYTEIHFNEYNSFPINYPPGGAQEKLAMAAALLDDFDKLLAESRITRVHWAQFQDSGYGLYCGLLDIYGRTKPVYWAFRWYSELIGSNRLKSTSDAVGVGSFVVESAEGGYEGIVWNRSGHAVDAVISPPTSDVSGFLVDEIVDEINAEPRPRPSVEGSILRLRLEPQAVIRFNTKSE